MRGHPLRHLIGIEPRDIHNQRGLDRIHIVMVIEDRAGHEVHFPPLGAALLGNNQRGGETPRARDHLISAVGAIHQDKDRQDDTAITDGPEKIGQDGCLLGTLRIGLADRQLAKIEKLEFNPTRPS